MKNPLIYITAIIAFAIGLQSCTKKDDMITTTTGTPGTLSAIPAVLVLKKTSAADTAKVIRLNLTKADYGFNGVVTNTLQIDKVSDNWAAPASVVLGANVLTQAYATADLNALLVKLGVTAGTATPIQIRVAYSVSVNLPPVYSNTVQSTVTTYTP